MSRTIVAMGGGGFSMEPDNPLLDDHVLDLARAARGRERPRVCFLGTASGDSPVYIAELLRRLRPTGRGQPPRRCSCAPRTTSSAFLLDQDVIYVGGGNTENMLAIWRVHGVDRGAPPRLGGGRRHDRAVGGIAVLVRDRDDRFVRDGPRRACPPGSVSCPGSHSPHYDGEANRRPRYHQLVAEGALPDGYAADDGAALVFDGPDLVEVVASRPAARGVPGRAPVPTVTVGRPSCRRATSAESGASRGSIGVPGGDGADGVGRFERAPAGGGRSRRSSPSRAARAAARGRPAARGRRGVTAPRHAGPRAAAPPWPDPSRRRSTGRRPERSTRRRARPKTRRSRSSSRGPQRRRCSTTERALETLERGEQVEGAGRRVRTGRDVERDDRVVEIGLVGDADRGRDVQPRDARGRAPRKARRARRPPRPASRRRRRRSRRDRCRRGRDGRSRPPRRRRRLDSGPCARSRSESCTPRRAPAPAPLGRWLADERARVARRHVDGVPRGGRRGCRDRLGAARRDCRSGSGCGRWSVPSARPGWSSSDPARSRSRPTAICADLVEAAGSEARGRPRQQPSTRPTSWPIARAWPTLDDLPDLPSDNALPRWLAEVAGYEVSRPAAPMAARGRHRRAARPGPLGDRADAPVDLGRSGRRWRRSGASPPTRAAELLVAGRTSADEPSPGSSGRRRRARGRSSRNAGCGRAARASGRPPRSWARSSSATDRRRSARSSPASATPRSWTRGSSSRTGSGGTRRPGRPPRIATPRTCCSPTRSTDPWLRALTASAVAAPIPVLLGGHTLVGPGLRLAVGRRRGHAPWT